VRVSQKKLIRQQVDVVAQVGRRAADTMLSLSLIQSGPLSVRTLTAKRPVLLEKYFYFCTSIVIALAITYGFSRTMGGRLIHPKTPRPQKWLTHPCGNTSRSCFLAERSEARKIPCPASLFAERESAEH